MHTQPHPGPIEGRHLTLPVTDRGDGVPGWLCSALVAGEQDGEFRQLLFQEQASTLGDER